MQFSSILTRDDFLCQTKNSTQGKIVVAQAVNMRKNTTSAAGPNSVLLLHTRPLLHTQTP